MFPSEQFFDLIDADQAFRIKVLLWNSEPPELQVSRAKNGIVSLKLGAEKFSGSATEVLWRINAVLARGEEFGGLRLTGEFSPSLDSGSGMRFTVLMAAASAASRKLPTETHYSVDVIYSDRWGKRPAVVQVEIDQGKPRLYSLWEFDKDTLVEISRFSRRAPPKDLHQCAVVGSRWAGSPDPSELYDAMYGVNEAEYAMAEDQADYVAFMRALTRRG